MSDDLKVDTEGTKRELYERAAELLANHDDLSGEASGFEMGFRIGLQLAQAIISCPSCAVEIADARQAVLLLKNQKLSSALHTGASDGDAMGAPDGQSVAP